MQRTLIITSGGIGDIVCLIPLLRRLRSDGRLVTLIYFGADPIHELLDDQDLIDRLIIRPCKWFLFRFCLSHLRFFEESLITHLYRGRVSSLISNMMAKRVVYSMQKSELSERHEIFHYQACLYSHSESSLVPSVSLTVQESRTIDQEYVLVQPFAGNGRAPYKQWQSSNWPLLLNSLSTRFPHITWVLVGEKGEQDQLMFDHENMRIQNLVGTTSLRQLRNLAAYCTGYIGLDTGLMHLVAAFGHPTITLFGGSNHKRFGYDVLDADRHKVIRKEMACHPCNDWFRPNRSRVSTPSDCPDFACIRTISVDAVREDCERFIAGW